MQVVWIMGMRYIYTRPRKVRSWHTASQLASLHYLLAAVRYRQMVTSLSANRIPSISIKDDPVVLFIFPG
jgi:hypothetical protein